MIKVTFEFPSLELLAAFQKSIPCASYVIVPDLYQITCYCEEHELSEALGSFKGKVVARQN